MFLYHVLSIQGICKLCSEVNFWLNFVGYAKRRKRRSGPLTVQKKKRRILPFVPSEDPAQRLKQMASLASALTALNIEFSDNLTYLPGMAPRSANEASLESGGMQALTKEDTGTMEHCKAMCKRGECPPFVVVFDSWEGYTVEADGPIKDMTFIAEYTGDVDYLKNREHDDCDSMMTLLLPSESAHNLVICADKRGNIARFISGINNHTQEGKKKLNCKCLRYRVNGESRVFLVTTRDIAKGERLYYNYNGYEDEYPTHHFV
ncbi:putative histone-lysine N-methyltransferase chromatin remodeling SET family [Lupinus albus]|uniref:[histone H3]-lysine(27) N-methyltransferase n=1 Tax=Lupinus albus TaxID=3870 RepID=A0A6A4Q5H8_LUPAL|nr:putative histone-lysine N-methyltransferase chromatin remodeling SET family [Lupinus albus]